MEDNNQDKKKTPKLTPPRGPKFNLYWIYGIIGLVVISSWFFPFSKNAEPISFEEFNQKSLQPQDVAKLEVVNKEYVDVYIKPDRLSQEKYKDVDPFLLYKWDRIFELFFGRLCM